MKFRVRKNYNIVRPDEQCHCNILGGEAMIFIHIQDGAF